MSSNEFLTFSCIGAVLFAGLVVFVLSCIIQVEKWIKNKKENG